MKTQISALYVCCTLALLCAGISFAAPGTPEQARKKMIAPVATPVATPATVPLGSAPAIPRRVFNLPSGVLDPVNESKIHVSSTDSAGNCPSGATKLESCSGVYSNGNSWEIRPCCRVETN